MGDPECDSSDEGSGGEPRVMVSVVDEVDGLPENLRFNLFDACFIVYSMGLYLCDIGSDLWLAHGYYVLGDYVFFGLTIGIVIFTSLVLTVLSWVWYKEDERNGPESRADWGLRILFHILQMAPILRYAHALSYGWQFRTLIRKRVQKSTVTMGEATAEERKLYYCMVKQDADASLLYLVETFVEAGPQMLMQFYILVLYGAAYADGSPFMVAKLVVSIVMSLCSMAWAITAYGRACRYALPCKQNISWKGTVILFYWHLSILTARVLALGLFSSTYKWGVFVVAGIHVVIVWPYIYFIMKTSICGSRYKEVFFDLLVTLIYIFQYLNINDEPTFWHYVPFYILMFLENAFMIIMWFVNVVHIQLWYTVWAFGGHFVTFFIGIILMLIYYLCFHPTKSIGKVSFTKYRFGHA